MIDNGEGRHLESSCRCPHPPEVHADSRRIGQPYQPSSNQDPMTRWIREQDPPPISKHAINW